MKIYVHKDGHVDLEAPIQMTEDQKIAFIDFFKRMFPGDVKVQDREEKSKNVGKREGGRRDKWTLDEYVILLSPERISRLSERIDRSEMSIQMKLGDFVPEFWAWMRGKGYSLTNVKELVKEFLNEKGGSA